MLHVAYVVCSLFSLCVYSYALPRSIFLSDTISMSLFQAVGAKEPGLAGCSSTEAWRGSGYLEGDWE